MSILKHIESHFGKQIHKLDANDVDELEKIQQWDRIRKNKYTREEIFCEIKHFLNIRHHKKQWKAKTVKHKTENENENENENELRLNEASSLDRINMTKDQLEYDWKKFTPTNLNIGTWPKIYTD